MQIGSKANSRPFAWAPFVGYLLFAVVVMVAVVLVFRALGAPTGGWLPFAIGGAIVGGMLGVVYPWLYDRVGRGGGDAP